MPRWILIAIVVCLIMPVFAQDTVTNQVLIAVNQERQRSNIAPLVMNPQLVDAAQNHSDDMAANAALTHIGSDGSQFWERIQRAGYNLSTGAENVLARRDTNPAGIFQQWFDSAPHRTNMLNVDYVEIGIAYARSASGDYYVTMVLAARPGIVAPQPAIATATSSPTLTATSIPPSLIPTVTTTRTLMPTDVILATIIAPPPTFAPTQTPLRNTIVTDTPMPTASDTDLRLVYDADSFSLVNVSGRILDLRGILFRSDTGRMEIERWNTNFLSQSLSGFTNGDCLQVWGLGNEQLFPKPIDCETRHSWLAVGDGFTFWRETDFFIVERNGVRIALCEVASGSCDITLSANFGTSTLQTTPILQNTPDAVAGVANVRLFITETSVTLVNWSSRPIDVSGLVFESESGVFAASRWDNGFLSSPLNALPAGDCLQIWIVGGQYEREPDECETRHAWVAVLPNEQFWRNTNVFHIRLGANVIATCETRVRTCDFNLP